jgi:hypothetical protein
MPPSGGAERPGPVGLTLALAAGRVKPIPPRLR